jgi:hypothetical protein
LNMLITSLMSVLGRWHLKEGHSAIQITLSYRTNIKLI